MVTNSRRTSASRNRLTISLDQDSYTALAQLAKERERSMNWIISRALKRFLQAEQQRATKPHVDRDLVSDR
jgi:predicted transcriptional regulator